MKDDPTTSIQHLLADLREHRIGRREFMIRAASLGLGGMAAAALATHSIADVAAQRGGAAKVAHMGTDGAADLVAKSMEASPSARLIQDAMIKRGLTPQTERAQRFSATGDDGTSSDLAIMPCTTEELTMEGSISLSADGFALGVLVQMSDVVTMESMETFVVQDGVLSSDRYTIAQLMDEGAASAAKNAGSLAIEDSLLDISSRQISSLATTTFDALLVDDASLKVHTTEELEALRRNMPIVSEMGLMIQMRTAVAACCSTSCFGCTSCSSFTINTIKART